MLASREAQFARELAAAVRLHPHEPIFPLLAGAEAVQRNDDAAVAWLNRAMQMAPGWDAPHEEVARWLFRRGRMTQGFLELRAAQERRRSSPTVACEALQRAPSAAGEFTRVAGSSDIGLDWMESVARCLPLESPATVTIDDALSQANVDGGRLRSARRALAAGEPQLALDSLEAAASPNAPQVLLLVGRAHLAAGNPDRALAAVDSAPDWDGLYEASLRLRARAQLVQEDFEGMRATLDRLRAENAGDPPGLARVWLFEGELEEQAEHLGRAISAYQSSQRLASSRAALLGIARASEQIGHLGRADRVYGELCALDGGSGAACQARDRVRESVRGIVQRNGAP